MKKNALPVFLLLAGALLLVYAAAAGGSSTDPLISLSYLRNTFTPTANASVDEAIAAAGNNAYAAAEARWSDAVKTAEASVSARRTYSWEDARFKQGDILTGLTGTQVMLLAGQGNISFTAGAVVDATDGVEAELGSELKPRHRYIIAEDTTALVVVTSRTAVIEYCGDYHTNPSTASTDYNAIASALKKLTLFNGTDTAYGEGFDLELAPTRIQALVMLIRLLGEETQAMASTAANPFPDVPAWADRYVAYAFDKGYTNGVEDNKFAPNRIATANMYLEFVLRALGYSSTAQTNINDAADRALSAGVITNGERSFIPSVDFLRADVAYLSWYALEAKVAGSPLTLHEKLQNSGVFSASDYQAAREFVPSGRL